MLPDIVCVYLLPEQVIVCNETVEAANQTDFSGTLTSIRYPSNYPNSVACSYTITSSIPDTTIQVDFLELSLESYSDNVQVRGIYIPSLVICTFSICTFHIPSFLHSLAQIEFSKQRLSICIHRIAFGRYHRLCMGAPTPPQCLEIFLLPF